MTRIKWFLTGLLTAMTLGVGAQVSPIPPANGFPLWGLPAAQGTSSNPFIDVVFTGQALGPVGNCTTAPAYSFTGDTNTGWSSSAADALCAVTGGTSRLSITSTAVTSTVPVLAPNGTAAAPSYAFSGDATKGFYSSGGNQVALSIGGGLVYRFDGNAFWNLSDSARIDFGSAGDVSLSRGAANRLDLASGDSLYLVSGGLGVGVTPPSAGRVQTSDGFVTATTGFYAYTSGSIFRGVSDGKVNFTIGAENAGVGLDFATDAVLKLRNRAQTGGATFNLIEQTAPSAPAANEVTIYAVDNGGGKTQLMALFSSGAAQQIAIQP